MQTAAAIELAKRINATSDAATLEQENIRLSAQIHDMKKRLAKLKPNTKSGKAPPKAIRRLPHAAASTHTTRCERLDNEIGAGLPSVQAEQTMSGIIKLIEERLVSFREELLMFLRPKLTTGNRP